MKEQFGFSVERKEGKRIESRMYKVEVKAVKAVTALKRILLLLSKHII